MGGPIVGAGAGVIAGLHLYAMGGFTGLANTISVRISWWNPRGRWHSSKGSNSVSFTNMLVQALLATMESEPAPTDEEETSSASMGKN